MFATQITSAFRGPNAVRALSCSISVRRNKNFSGKKGQDKEEIIQALNRRISDYKKYLARHSHTTYLGKKALSSLEILVKELANIQQMNKPNASAIPHSVSVEIVSNGTTHLRPCVVLHTTYRDYLFNCPEGTSRFLAANRLKANNLTDIFFTRDTWDHFAGVSGLLKTPVASTSTKSERTIRLYGSHNKSKYFEQQNDHPDADFPAVIPTKLSAYLIITTTLFEEFDGECPLSSDRYSDDGITVHFIPVSTYSLPQRRLPEKLDIAFFVELKPPPRSLDIEKIKELKIPGGPHMKQLKNGEDITLTDGRLIKAEDVLCAPETQPQPACLIVECSDLKKLPSLRNNTLLRECIDGKKKLRYIFHFTEKSVINSEEYITWMNSFGQNVEHVVVNGTGPCLPHMESVYRMNIILNNICSKLFPLLHPKNFNGTMQQDDECEKVGNSLYARPFQRFFLRKPHNFESTPPNVSLILTDLLLQLTEDSATAEAITHFTARANLVRSTDIWPKISFLGTSSAVPSNFRNVSAYFLQFTENSCIFVDCGEGSYGQLRVLFGDNVCEDLLLKLSAVFITHGHQDHFHGIFTIIQRRKEIFLKRNMAYKPLIVAAGRYVIKFFGDVDRTFGNCSPNIHVIDISKLLWLLSKERSYPVEAVDLTSSMPAEIASAESLGLKSIVAVKVVHSKNAVGFIFTDLKNQKFVFSGDTMPSEQLVNHGKNAMVLVHESTFADDEEAHALYKKHSTMKQAFDVATRMGAKNLVLTHFSAKYPKVPPLPDYIERAGNVTIAMDNMTVTPSDLQLSAKLIPVLRAVFAKEINDMNQRSLKRHLQDDILSQTLVDTLGGTMQKRRTPEIVQDTILSTSS